VLDGSSIKIYDRRRRDKLCLYPEMNVRFTCRWEIALAIPEYVDRRVNTANLGYVSKGDKKLKLW